MYFKESYLSKVLNQFQIRIEDLKSKKVSECFEYFFSVEDITDRYKTFLQPEEDEVVEGKEEGEGKMPTLDLDKIGKSDSTELGGSFRLDSDRQLETDSPKKESKYKEEAAQNNKSNDKKVIKFADISASKFFKRESQNQP